MRTVTVMEHEVIFVTEAADAPLSEVDREPWLTEVEAQALLRLNDVRRGFCQRVLGGVKLAQYCGIVRLPNCVIEVLPKVGIGDAREPDELGRSRSALLAMLHSARNIAITKIGAVPQATVGAPLLDIFIEAFLSNALEQARRGLLSRYMLHAEDLPVIKGRFQAHGHVRRNLGRPHLLHCEYDDFTGDNVYNQAIRATLNVCRGWITTAATQRLWFEAHARYASISSVKMSSAEVVRLARDRTTRRYAAVLTWCEWLLALASPSMSSGVSQAPGLLFDMNKLFEAHVAGLEELAAGSDRIVYRQGPQMALAKRGNDGVFTLKPDVTVWQLDSKGAASRIDRVVDAKWKRLDLRATDFGVDEADVYQMLAYALRFGCDTVELAYPMPGNVEPSLQVQPVFHMDASTTDCARRITIAVKLIRLEFDSTTTG